jgi:ABC-type methionine transport system permease subunit
MLRLAPPPAVHAVKVSLSRAVVVTVGLSAIGAVCGAGLGGLALLVDLQRFIRDVEMGGASGVFL